MARLDWGSFSTYDRGVDRGAVYSRGTGSPWVGLISVEEVVAGGDVSSVYFDGVKTIDLVSAEDFALNISAYTYPPEVEVYESSDEMFGFTYRTGTETEGHIHLVYNSTLFSSGKTRKTIAEGAEPNEFAWTLFAVPTEVPGAHNTAHLVVDISAADPEALAAFEDLLYGTPTTGPRFPTGAEVIAIFASRAILTITDHGDGTWTAEGPDEAIQMLDSTTFQISWPSATYITDDTYTISSW